MAIDLARTVSTVALGTKAVDPTASFQAGGILTMDTTSGLLRVADKEAAFGVAKWNKSLIATGVVVSESVTLTGVVASTLKHANISNIVVKNSTGTVEYDLGTDYSNGDYFISATNGTVTRTNASTIGSGATVLISYTYELTNAQIQMTHGTNFMNSLDDTLGSGMITCFQNFAEIYTDQYDTTQTYTPFAQLYVGADGLFTTNTTSTFKYGKVIKVPTAADPYLGVQIGM